MKIHSLLFILLAGAALAATAGTSTDPAKARFITTDIDLFWSVYERAKPDTAVALYQQEYLDKGSDGLKKFTQLDRVTGANLARALERSPRFYAALKPYSRTVPQYEGAMRASFRKLQELYPAAAFPDVYFVIGKQNSAGKPSDMGLLIGVEMMGKNPGAPEDELSNWLKAVVKPMDGIPAIVAHELIHYQQKASDNTLLTRALKEGICDLVGEMIAGAQINPHLQTYGDQHEAALWREFAGEMHGTDVSNWL
ncbi:MAG TPA: hypothetical protein VIT92_00895, partial [Burkholderiaceae bacterium]